MTKAKLRDSPEAKRWLIVGAYQAGATEKHVARISGLSKTAVRNIILNYQRTGTPCMPKKIPNKIKQKLIVEYDDNGEIIDSDDDNEEETVPPIQQKNERCLMNRRTIMKKNTIASTRNLIKRSNNTSIVTTKDIINYAMDQMRITDNNHLNISTQKLAEKNGESPSTPVPSWHSLSSPPQQHYQSSSSSCSSLSPPSSSSKKRLAPLSKFDQTIRGYELWTHDDDMLLLNHVLHHLHGGGWNELEVRFDGRHSARLCYDRWRHLKSLLLKGITDKPNTPW
ncbi:uncharacterized protein EV154DRAFT_522076 [Mucor mucedo]|uniref:uncharacterized protein n=1 Tax=Mucor mucedo TaxID=29922 RepID=UPI00222067B3|nr:uncharacterized protein EV154DRAFT_522076 [Mucor mucedo]KAI7884734.1 hypothetical protein EV154DRAFT_522076 [Mucor mucedo]